MSEPSIQKKIVCTGLLSFVYAIWVMLWYCLLHSIYVKDLEGSVTYVLSLFCFVQLIVCGKMYFNEENHLENFKTCFKWLLYASLPIISILAAVICTITTGFTVMVALLVVCSAIEIIAVSYYLCSRICCRRRSAFKLNNDKIIEFTSKENNDFLPTSLETLVKNNESNQNFETPEKESTSLDAESPVTSSRPTTYEAINHSDHE